MLNPFPHIDFPAFLTPPNGALDAVVKSASSFYTLLLNIGVILMILYSGIAIEKLVRGYIEEDPTTTTEARHTIMVSFMIIGAISALTSFLQIIWSII